MRLQPAQSDSLKQSIVQILPDAKIYLFGSRVDDLKKGGDIDILIIANRILTFSEKAKIEMQFFMKFGEQKLDLVSFSNESEHTFKKIAFENAITL